MMKSMIYFSQISLMSMSVIMMFIMSIPSNNKMMHPIILGLILMKMSILCSMNLSIYNNNHWFSFLMFLIIIGGLMIIFLYFTSFISNMKMTMKWNFIKTIPLKMLSITVFWMLIMLMSKYNLNWYNNFNEILPIFSTQKNNMNMNFLYSHPKSLISIMLMIYLLMSLTIIVKMCISKKFSIRKINYEKIYS